MSRIKTFCRFRPESNRCDDIRIGDDGCSVEVACEGDRKWAFQMDKVFSESSSQKEIYDSSVSNLLDQFLTQNKNVTIFAYGQTGSGKTYTILGNEEARGICFHFIYDIFSRRLSPILISAIEIYNDQLSDLLSYDPESKVKLMESYTGEVVMRGLETRCATNPYQALSIIDESSRKRRTTSHDMNEQSSRSHAVFIFSYEMIDSAPKFNIVDLAGSERVSKTNSDGVVLKEAGYINQSLSFLEQAVLAALDPRRSHVPYRQCILTQLLRDSIGGNSLLTMIACLWPHEDHLNECISTLRFIGRMMRLKRRKIEVKPGLGMADCKLEVERLRHQVDVLSRELALRDSRTTRFHQHDDNDTDERTIRETVGKFIQDGVDPVITSQDHALQLMRQFRSIVNPPSRKSLPAIIKDKPMPVAPQIEERSNLSQKELLELYRDGDGREADSKWKLAKKQVKSVNKAILNLQGEDDTALQMSLVDAKSRQEMLQMALLQGFEDWLKIRNR